MDFFLIGQNLALLFLTLPFSVQMTIIINNLNRKDIELPYFCYPNLEIEDAVSKVLKHKEKKPLCPWKCYTSCHWQCCPLKASLDLPCTLMFCQFQVCTGTNYCFSLTLNMLVLKFKQQCQEASISIENTKSNPSALIMKLPPHF